MISHTRARYGAVSPSGLRRPGRGRRAASSHQPRHARCPQGAKARSRASCRYSHRHRPRPARLQRQREEQAGTDVPGLVAGRLATSPTHCMPSLGAPGGVDASSSSISTRPTPWPARRSRATTGQRPVAVPMPTSHPYKGSEQEARQGPRVYVHGPALRCAPGLRLGRCFDVVLSVTCACLSSFPYRCVALCFLAAGGQARGLRSWLVVGTICHYGLWMDGGE